MRSYRKKLKRGKDGIIVRYIGQNAKGVPEKFRLGYDDAMATRKERLIQALWVESEINHPKPIRQHKPSWPEGHLKAAKAIARGELARLPRGSDSEDPILYLKRIDYASELAGERFQPEDVVHFQNALERVTDDIATSKETLSLAVGVQNAIGKTLGEAITEYESHLLEFETEADGKLNPWGKTQLDQMKSIRSYISDPRFGNRNFLDADLAEIGFDGCKSIIEVFTCRPLTLLSKLTTRMARKTASNFIKTLNKFFIWLDGEEKFGWQLPRRYSTIDRRSAPWTPEELYTRKQQKKSSVIHLEHLKMLYEYSLPNERAIMLLGLNCAFGAAEIGQLRTGFLYLDNAVIDGIRFKTGNDTKHHLWPTTVTGLRWALENRSEQAFLDKTSADIVFMTERGMPLWHHTQKGNTSNGVGNVWGRLIKRIRKEHPTFPKYSFNKLRKTSATRILNIADAASASMILAHKTLSDDELLHHYVQIPWDKLFAAQVAFGVELAGIFDVHDCSPWINKRRNHIGVQKANLIHELHGQKMSAEEISEKLGVSLATIYRHLKNKG